MSTTPRLLLIAPHNSYRIGAYIEAARALGVALTIASPGRHSLVSEVAQGIHIDFGRPEEALATLLREAGRQAFAGVIGSEDASVPLASRMAEALGLPHNPPDAARLTRRKDLARKRLADAGVAAPWHRRIDLAAPLGPQLENLPWPCVVKPVAMSGSRGVIRVDDPGALERAVARIRPLLDDLPLEEERRYLLVEAFVDGPEVALEGMLQGGELQTLALFDKPEPLQGPFFEESYYITPSRHDEITRKAIADMVAAACRAYGLREGPVHAELRLGREGPVVLEVAARTIGGQCARLLQLATGRSLEELVLAQAMGRPLSARPWSGGAGVLMIPIPEGGILRRVEGQMAARKVPGVLDLEISIREGYRLVPLPEGESYLGFIFARGRDAGEAEAALRAAHACLKVVVAPELPVR